LGVRPTFAAHEAGYFANAPHFVATLLRSPDPSQEFAQMHLKARVVELMVENAPQVFSEA
jgi:hypothetical protein